jgi:hypothetical protein
MNSLLELTDRSSLPLPAGSWWTFLIDLLGFPAWGFPTIRLPSPADLFSFPVIVGLIFFASFFYVVLRRFF